MKTPNGGHEVREVSNFIADCEGPERPQRAFDVRGHLSAGQARNGSLSPDRPMRILFFDDDPRRHLGFASHARGHEVDHSWFVEDAVRRLARHRYDLVCLDYDLETEGFARTGLDVARFIRRLRASHRPAAVFIHSWNPQGADRMYELLEPVYRAGVSLLRGEFGRVPIPLWPAPADQIQATTLGRIA